MKNNLKTKILCLMAFLILTTISAYAQPKFGVRVGVNISKQELKSDSINVDPKSKFGLGLAVVSEFPLGEVISFAPELHWLQKGYKIDDINLPVGELTATFNYLELPLLVRANFGETAKFFVFGGPSIGSLLSGRTEDGSGNAEDLDFDDWSRFELGAHLGAGFSVGPIVVDIRYLLGISNIGNDLPDDVEIRNTGFGGGVSVVF